LGLARVLNALVVEHHLKRIRAGNNVLDDNLKQNE
jgi:hypothetical protein